MTPRTYRIRETVVYEVHADTEQDADRIFQERVGIDCEDPVRYVGVDDRDIVQIVNDHGRRVVVAPPR